MYDEDTQFSKVEGDSRKLATLASYKITDNAAVRFTQKHFTIPHESSLNRRHGERLPYALKIVEF